MLNTTCGQVYQTYRVLGLGIANLEWLPLISETLCAQDRSKFPDLRTGLQGSEP